MNTTRRTLPMTTAAAAAVLALAGCGGGATAPAASPAAASPAASASAAPTPAAQAAGTTAPRQVEIRYQGGKVQGGLQQIDVAAGTAVTVVITSDVAEEAHLHGYDRSAELTPGKPGTIAFTADTPGVFDLELHGSDAKLARVEVR